MELFIKVSIGFLFFLIVLNGFILVITRRDFSKISFLMCEDESNNIFMMIVIIAIIAGMWYMHIAKI